MSKPTIYLDHHATTPLDPNVLKAMMPYLDMSTGLYGNEASGHEMTAKLEDAVTKARCQVAELIGAEPEEIYFTSGATESNNLVIASIKRSRGRLLITSPLEHSSVLGPSNNVKDNIYSLSVHHDEMSTREMSYKDLGITQIWHSAMAANNETGEIFDVSKISKDVSKISKEVCGTNTLFHTDATQAVGYGAFKVSEHIHMASLSSHKIYGPKGVGALYVKKGYERFISPQMLGGNQERGMRSGTTNVPGIIGFGAACEIMITGADSESLFLRICRDELWKTLKLGIDGIQRNGAPLEKTLPHSLNVYIPGVDAETLRMMVPHIAMSTGSACSAKSNDPSHVLKALYPDEPERWTSSIRLSLGRFTRVKDAEQAAKDITEAANRARQIKEQI